MAKTVNLMFILLLIGIFLAPIQGCEEALSPISTSLRKLDVGCDACKAAIELTRAYIHENKTETDADSVVVYFCNAFKIEDPRVCTLIVEEFKPMLFYVIVNEALSPSYSCGALDLCPKIIYPKWNVTFSKPAPPVRPSPKIDPKGKRIYMLHFSDAHVDFKYTPGLDTDCGEPICCRPPNKVGEPGTAAGKWGDIHCDTPTWVFENMLTWIGKNLPELSYAIFTGDIPPHDVWTTTRNESISTAQYVYTTFKKLLPNLKLFPAMGNHEGIPVNEFAPRDIGGQWNMSWLYTPISKLWKIWLPQDAAQQAEYTGYYTALAPGGIRIVSLNTNLGCNNMNWFLSLPSAESSDPDNQLHWLENVLSKAEEVNETVYIIKHITTSQDFCGLDWWTNYHKIIERYRNTILGDFAGHTHSDLYTVTYSASKNNTSIEALTNTYFPGAVTPYPHANPGFRIFEIDAKTKAIVNFHEYSYNMTLANIEGEPKWDLLYSAKTEYFLNDMSPESWHQLRLNMASNPALNFQYYMNLGKQYPRGPCDETCLKNLRCDIINHPPGVKILC